jgi:hypothetical protein
MKGKAQQRHSAGSSDDGTVVETNYDSSTQAPPDSTHEYAHSSKFGKRMLRLALYSLITLSLFWVFLSRFDMTPAQLKATNEVLKFCSTENFPVQHHWTYTVSDAWPSWFRTLIHINAVDYVIVPLIFLAVYAICAALLYVLTPVGVSFMLCAPMIYFMVEMLRQRTYLLNAKPTQYEDNVWGFGQVLALLMWLPFSVSFIILCK